MPTLSHHVARKQLTKEELENRYTAVHKEAAKKDQQLGHTRTYQPFSLGPDDEPRPSDRKPDTGQLVQIRCLELLREAEHVLVPLMDDTLTVDAGNQAASGNIVVDGQTIAENVPVAMLIWLENRLANLATLVGKMPLVDPSHKWDWDEASDCWRSEEGRTQATDRVYETLVKFGGDERHPPQTESYSLDKPVGLWTRVNLSGSMKAEEVRALKARILKLHHAVEVARHEATSIHVEERHIGQNVFTYLLADIDMHGVARPAHS
jgi:hypothetical protein